VLAPVEQVVDLQQVELLRAQTGERLVDLLGTRLTAPGPDLRCVPEPGAEAEFVDQVAEHGFGATVHRRSVDHPAAALDERLQHAAQSVTAR